MREKITVTRKEGKGEGKTGGEGKRRKLGESAEGKESSTMERRKQWTRGNNEGTRGKKRGMGRMCGEG